MPTIYYMDYVNGADVNDGASWVNAKKTIGGFTSAILVPGDVIKVAKSPDPTSLGQVVTWTNVASSVTLSDGTITANVDLCESGWTAGTGVTLTYDTTTFKQGSASLKMVTAGTVTTARKLAYKAISDTDFSGYEQISFWFKNQASLAAGILQMKLCSDVAGDTPVDTFDIPVNALITAHWAPLVIDKGSALGSSIQSVAIYSTATYASKTNYFDNIIVCKASSENDSLNLTSLISKNSGDNEGWYPIQSINETTVVLDCYTETTPSTVRGYYGTTETVLTYKRETIKTTILDGDAAGFTFTIQDSGTLGSLIQWEGGYNTATNTQDGETIFDGQSCSSCGIYATGKSYNSLNYISCVRYYYGIYPYNVSYSWTISNINCVANYYGLTVVSSYDLIVSGYCNCNNCYSGIYIYQISAQKTYTINSIINVNNCHQNGIYTYSYVTLTCSEDINANNSGNYGFYQYASGATTLNGSNLNINNNVTCGYYISAGSLSVVNSDISANNCATGIYIGTGGLTGITFNGTVICNSSTSAGINLYRTLNTVFNETITLNPSTGNGITLHDAKNAVFNSNVTIDGGTYGLQYIGTYPNSNKFNAQLSISNTSTYGVYLTGDSANGLFIKKLILSSPGSYGIYNSTTPNVVVNSGSCSGATTAAIYTNYFPMYLSNFAIDAVTFATGMSQFSDGGVYLSNCDVAPNVNKIYLYGGLIQSDNGTRHTASGIAWKISPTSADRCSSYPMRLSLAKIAVNADAEVTVTCWFRRDNTNITGTLFCEGGQITGVANDVSTSMTAAIDTWEQVTINFTPTEQGVVEICALAYGGTEYNVWVDDLGVSQ